MHSNRGFTLIEVLLAMAITVFVAAVAYAGLSSAITATERHEQQAQRLAAIQLALGVLEKDIRFASARGITDEYGDLQPPMMGGDTEDAWLQLTRNGWDNPMNVPRSTLQRVRYYLQGNELWRDSWSVLDRADEQTTLQRVMVVEGINSYELRFLDGNATNADASEIGGEWVSDWPADASNDNLPRAVEVEFDFNDLGKVTRVYGLVSP